MQSAEDIIALLDLQPHPEGGYYRETFRDGRQIDGRAASTAIYFLLKRGQRSHWHRVDAVEIWHWYAGAPLVLHIADCERREAVILGNAPEDNQRPQAIIPANAWQSAVSQGDWTLIGCTVAPGFEFAGFELAPIGWRPE